MYFAHFVILWERRYGCVAKIGGRVVFKQCIFYYIKWPELKTFNPLRTFYLFWQCKHSRKHLRSYLSCFCWLHTSFRCVIKNIAGFTPYLQGKNITSVQQISNLFYKCLFSQRTVFFCDILTLSFPILIIQNTVTLPKKYRSLWF